MQLCIQIYQVPSGLVEKAHNESCQDGEDPLCDSNDCGVLCKDARDEAAAKIQPSHEEEAEPQGYLQDPQQHCPCDAVLLLHPHP